jgi:hypothetical protein
MHTLSAWFFVNGIRVGGPENFGFSNGHMPIPELVLEGVRQASNVFLHELPFRGTAHGTAVRVHLYQFLQKRVLLLCHAVISSLV